MTYLGKLQLWLLAGITAAILSCGDDDEPTQNQTPEQMQTSRLVDGSPWVPGTVIQEIDGDITDDRFSDFSISFSADAEGNNKQYTVANSSGEAFEAGTKSWDYVDNNLNRIERLDNGFQFDIQFSNNDTELQISLTVDESGTPLGRTANTTGGYVFNLVQQ